MMNWFDEHGWILLEIPEECAEDCSHSGRCDDDVEYWVKKLGFEAPRHLAIPYLREFGAWDDEELAAKSDEDLSQIVLWLFCNDMTENDMEQPAGLIH